MVHRSPDSIEAVMTTMKPARSNCVSPNTSSVKPMLMMKTTPAKFQLGLVTWHMCVSHAVCRFCCMLWASACHLPAAEQQMQAVLHMVLFVTSECCIWVQGLAIEQEQRWTRTSLYPKENRIPAERPAS